MAHQSPYVVAWQVEPRRLIPLAHRNCAKSPKYDIHRPLAEDFDYGGRTCNICSLPLVRQATQPQPQPAPRPPADGPQPVPRPVQRQLPLPPPPKAPHRAQGRGRNEVVHVVTTSRTFPPLWHRACLPSSFAEIAVRTVQPDINLDGVCPGCGMLLQPVGERTASIQIDERTLQVYACCVPGTNAHVLWLSGYRYQNVWCELHRAMDCWRRKA